MQDLVQEAQQAIDAASDIPSLMNATIPYIALEYVDRQVIGKILASTRSKLNKLGNKEGERVLVIDAQAIFFAAFTTSADPAQNALDRVQSLADTIPHDYIILADDSSQNFRYELYPEYKSSRKEKPEGFREAKKQYILSAMKKMQTIGIKGYEFDDVAASISFRCKVRKHSCIIATEDKDLLQCVGFGCMTYSPKKHVYISETTLEEKYMIEPKQMVDWLCLVGKDDTPSAKHFGAETASKALRKYKSVLEIYENAEDLTPAKAASIKEFVDSGSYELAKELHSLRYELDVNW